MGGLGEIVDNKLRVYFTIDTETSIGGAWETGGSPVALERTVFGEVGSRCYGIPLIMDILEEFGFHGTFFVEVFCSSSLGLSGLASVFDVLQKRGHDVQLHLHPVQRFYAEYVKGGPRREQDLLFQLSPAEQRQLIADGVSIFRHLSGRMPRAFRAGCYGASEATLAALREHGVVIDSSYNLAFLDKTCGFRNRPLNAPVLLEGVYEFPVTNFVSGGGGYKPLEISAVSVSEIIGAIRNLRQAGCRDVVLVFHSFSFLKERDSRFEKCRPDAVVIRRFRRLCSELARLRDEVQVSILGDADVSAIRAPGSQTVPKAPWVRSAMRKVVQGVNLIPWV